MKTNLILLILGLVLGVPCYLTLQAEEMEYQAVDAIPRLFPGFVPNNVTFIQLQRRKSDKEIQAQKLQGDAQFNVLVFQREGEGWVLGNTEHRGLPVDAAAVDRNLLDQIKAMRIDKDTLVKQDATPEYLQENQLSPQNGLVIRCKIGAEGPEVATLVKGKSTKEDSAETELDAYLISRPDRPREVVLYEPASKRWHVSLRSKDWLNKRIHEFTMSNVASFYFKNEFGSAGFKKKPGSDTTWIAIKEQCSVEKIDAVRLQEVTNLIDRFTRVQAEGYARGKIDTDISGAKVEIRVKLKTGEEYGVWVLAKTKEGNSHRCVSSERAFLFLWPDIFVDAFGDKNPRDLFD